MSADPVFENLVQLYYRDLYRFGLSLTGNETDAADLPRGPSTFGAKKRQQLHKATSVKSWLLKGVTCLQTYKLLFIKYLYLMPALGITEKTTARRTLAALLMLLYVSCFSLSSAAPLPSALR